MEDTAHTSGGVFIAIDGAMPTVVDKARGAANNSRQWEKDYTSMDQCQRELQGFAMYLLMAPPEGWSQRDEALF